MTNVYDLRQHVVLIDELIDRLEELKEDTDPDIGQLKEAFDRVLYTTVEAMSGMLEAEACEKPASCLEEGKEPEPKPDPLLQHFRPDEIAECWSGVDEKLYRELWGLMNHLPPMPGPDEIADMCPDDIRTYDRSVAAYWDKISPTDRKILNRLAEKNCRIAEGEDR